MTVGPLHTVAADIHHTDVAELFPGIDHVAYLLTVDDENIWLYSSLVTDRHLAAIEALGGVDRQYLNHRDEASPGCDIIRDHFGAPLHCHVAEREAVQAVTGVDATFEERHQITPSLEARPAAGHVAGSTTFVLRHEGKTTLFPSDTVYPLYGEWHTFLDERSDPEAMLSTLDLYDELDVDLICPSLFAGETVTESVSADRWHTIVEDCRVETQRIIDERS